MRTNRRMTLDERAARLARVCDNIGVRLDANETMAFARQLEQIEARLFEVKYPDGHGIELVPMNRSIDPGALSYTYRFQNIVGEAKRVSNWATDFPRVDVQGQEVTHRLENYGASYGYNLQQLRSAGFANYPLDQQLNIAARRVVMRKLDENIWFGDTSIAVYGLANSTLVSPTSVITGDWPTATAQEILDDAQKLISQAEVATKGVEKSDSVAFAVSTMQILAKKYMGADAPGKTVLAVLKENNPGVAFYQSYKLENADAGGTHPRAIAWTNDPELVEALVPTEFEILPAVDQGGQFEVKVMGRMGGVAIRRPLSVTYMDDLEA